jgi:hypothetical protein
MVASQDDYTNSTRDNFSYTTETLQIYKITTGLQVFQNYVCYTTYMTLPKDQGGLGRSGRLHLVARGFGLTLGCRIRSEVFLVRKVRDVWED